MSIRVSVVLALADRQEVVELELAEGSRVSDAIAATGFEQVLEQAGFGKTRVGIWSRSCALDTVLRHGDRVELYRPLVVDAREMRRLRARRKG